MSAVPSGRGWVPPLFLLVGGWGWSARLFPTDDTAPSGRVPSCRTAVCSGLWPETWGSLGAFWLLICPVWWFQGINCCSIQGIHCWIITQYLRSLASLSYFPHLSEFPDRCFLCLVQGRKNGVEYMYSILSGI